MKCAFIGCEEPSISLSEFCWNHIADKDAYRIKLINAINNGHDFTGHNFKKIVLKNVQIEKALLAKTNFSQADLSSSHVFDSNLQGADLVGADLSNCDMSHSDMRNSDLTKAVLTGSRLWSTLLTGANLTECDMSGTDFWNARLCNVRMWHTNFSQAKSITKASFCRGKRFFDDPRINEIGELSAEEAYRDLKQYFLASGRYNDASWASFREKTIERRLFKKRGDLNYFPSFLMSVLCGYGEKPYRIVLSSLGAIFTFAFLYSYFNTVESSLAIGYVMNWSDYLYYSAITFTTVGYGDFIPKAHSAFRLLSSVEAFMGVFLSGLFVFTLARKYSAR